MKIVRAVLLVVLVAPALVVVGATRALACSRVPPEPDPVALKDAAVVFSGTVAEIEPGVDIGFDRVTWTFAVEQVYKGDVPETQEVTSHTQSAACGLAFKEEKRYVVFAYRQGGGLETNVCMNTRPLADDADLKMEPISDFVSEEPSPQAAEPDDDSGWDPFVVGSLGTVALMAILTIAALATRRRKVS